jgi:hypothetical protein
LPVVSQKFVVRDLVRSADSARAALNLHSGEESAVATRLTRFLDDLKREDWVKKAQSAAGAGMTLFGVDPWAIVGAALSAAVVTFFAVALLAEGLVTLVLGAGGAAVWLLFRVLYASGDALGRFFAANDPTAALLASHLTRPEQRFYAVVGGRPPFVRVTDAFGHAAKIGVAVMLVAAAFGALVGFAAFQPAAG